jgi:hypothetical protein
VISGNVDLQPGTEKSFISLFIITPVAGTMSWEPKRVLMVLVREMARPVWSAVAM